MKIKYKKIFQKKRNRLKKRNLKRKIKINLIPSL